MLEPAAAVSAGLGVLLAILLLGGPNVRATPPTWATTRWTRWWSDRADFVRDAGMPGLTPVRLTALLSLTALTSGLAAATLTWLPALAVAGAAGGAWLLHAAIAARARRRQAERQDAVLEAVRMLRQLLEAGATSINQAIGILAERGPLPLRPEFRAIAGKSVGRRQAWKDARTRVAEPLFDMLAAAVLIQRPGGGELAPLFADLEASVSAAQEVEREARALQAQARSASTMIVALPLVFLTVLAALRSPYLDAFRRPDGELFLLGMLGVMAAGHAWMRRLLILPGLQRVRLSDA